MDIEFGNFLEIYYKDMDVRLRENTMYTKRYIIDLKIKPYFEKKILSEITVADVRAWQNELLTYKDKNGKGYSPTYLKTVNCQLTAIFNYAMRYYNLQDNPCRKAGAIGKSKGEPKDFWMQEEFNAFLETVSDKPETRMAFLLLYWTGMRIGEQLVIPVYLNEKIVLDMLAIIEDGFSKVSEVSTSYESADKINTKIETGFSTKNILEKLLKIQLNAHINGDSTESDRESSKSEKVHTNVSLFFENSSGFNK